MVKLSELAQPFTSCIEVFKRSNFSSNFFSEQQNILKLQVLDRYFYNRSANIYSLDKVEIDDALDRLSEADVHRVWGLLYRLKPFLSSAYIQDLLARMKINHHKNPIIFERVNCLELSSVMSLPLSVISQIPYKVFKRRCFRK